MTEAGELFYALSKIAKSREIYATDIKDEIWSYNLNIKDGRTVGTKLFQSADEKGREIVLSIEKEAFSSCPELPESLAGWFDGSGYEDFRKEDVKPVSRRVFQTEEGEVTRIFLDSDRRTREFAQWKKARILWRKGERVKEAKNLLFDELYRVYEKMKRDDTLDFFVANGFFYSGLSANLHYPLILSRAELRYSDGKMEIVDKEEDTIFSREILNDLPGFGEERVLRAAKEVRRSKLHPAEENIGERLLQNLAGFLSPNCRYSKGGLFILPTDWFIIYEKPTLLVRKKRNEARKFLESFGEFYEKNDKLPLPLEDFFRPKRRECGEAKDIILPQKDSPAQKKILNALLSSSLVTVDAPPGVGKTRSIYNFISYFLSKGKRVLAVTPQKRGVYELLDKLPESLKLLTVYYRKNARLELERAITALCDAVESKDIHALRERCEALKESRNEKAAKIRAFRKKLSDARRDEQKGNAFVFEGEKYSLSKMARFLAENENLLHLIPGSVKEGQSLPLTKEELSMLYETNGVFTPKDLREMTEPLPKSEKLLPPYELEELLKTRKRLFDKERGLLMELPEFRIEDEKILYHGELVAENIDKEKFEAAKKIYSELDFEWLSYPWAREAVLAGRTGGEAREAYLELERAVQEVKSARDSATLLLLGNRVEIETALVHDARVIKDLEKIRDLFKEHGDIPTWNRIFDRRLKVVLDGILINGYPITSAMDAEIALMELTLTRARTRLNGIWRELLGSSGEKDYLSLADNLNDADDMAAARMSEIRYAIDWYDKKRGEFVKCLENAGIRADLIIPATDPFTTPRQQLASEVNWLLSTWPTLSDLISLVIIEKRACAKIFQRHKSALLNRSSALSKRMLFAINAGRVQDYAKEYELLLRYESLEDDYKKRGELLERLAEVAPDYAASIACQKGGGALKTAPEDILTAYKARQFDNELKKCEEIDFTRDADEDFALNQELTECLVWEKFLETIEKTGAKGRFMRLYKSIKKSSEDTRRNKLNEREREEFMESLPLVIASADEVFSLFNPHIEKFDAILIDNASLLDSMYLSLLSLSHKVMIFGDRRLETHFALNADEELSEELENLGGVYKSLSDTSMYEILRAVTEPYHLREEFRSPKVMTRIMNKALYENELVPMNLNGDEEFVRLINYEIAGTVDPLRRVNFAEAEEIVLLISACIGENEYEYKTFGVISLGGADETALIFEIAMRRLGAETLQKIGFMAGTPKDFEGIEKDIIFISTVDDEETMGKAPSKYEAAFAVSRAKEEVFIVHSRNSFPDDDPRRLLLETPLGRKDSDAKAKTKFGREIAEALRERGFNVKEQFILGDMTLEIAVFGGKRAVIIPIGDEKGEKVNEAFLSRLDWEIIYVRASKYYRNPKETMNGIVNALRERGVKEKDKQTAEGKELLERIFKSVANIREEYRMRDLEDNDG